MTVRPRRKVFTLDKYLEKVKDKTIRSDQDVQRLSDQWDANMRNELVRTILTDDYIPPVILAEVPLGDGLLDTYILDGLQRSTTLAAFKYGNKKVTQKLVIDYQARVKNDDGLVEVRWLQFDMKNKSYKDMPKELQDVFDEYQLETVIHEDCTMERCSELVLRYNLSKSMSTSQKAFTYIDKFAKQIRGIIKNTHFFEDCGKYTKSELRNGTVEKIVCESYMTTYELENWKKKPADMGKFINDNGDSSKLAQIGENFMELSDICMDKYFDFFNSKNTCVFMAIYAKVKEFDIDVEAFGDFLDNLGQDLGDKMVGDKSWNILNENRSTKDKTVVIGKIEFLNQLMMDFFAVSEDDLEKDIVGISDLAFLQAQISSEITQDDVDFYNECLEDLLDNTIKVDSKLRDKENHINLLTIYTYLDRQGYDESVISSWLEDYGRRINFYKKSADAWRVMLTDFNVYKSGMAA